MPTKDYLYTCTIYEVPGEPGNDMVTDYDDCNYNQRNIQREQKKARETLIADKAKSIKRIELECRTYEMDDGEPDNLIGEKKILVLTRQDLVDAGAIPEAGS